MPLASFLGKMLESGKVIISANNVEALEIRAADKKIDIAALNKDLLKSALAMARGTEEKKGVGESIKGKVSQIKGARSDLGAVKELAEELSEAGITVTLSYKDSVVVTLGAQADAKVSKIVTGTKAIEINSTRKLVELGL